MRIRPADDADVDGCIEVLRELPDYFTPDTHQQVAVGVRADDAWLAEDDGRIVGFVLLQQRYRLSAEITFAAVSPRMHRRGLGRAITSKAIEHARSLGLRAIEVKTLDESSDYEPYIATRAFWERMGFVQIDCIDPLPGWQPGNPSAIYVLPLT
jgi:N-acetylglutamate synthase-like GNAT family acetyltransferase